MDLELTEKCVLLIGAGRGLGGAAALAIAREGAHVAVVARTRVDVEARASDRPRTARFRDRGNRLEARGPRRRGHARRRVSLRWNGRPVGSGLAVRLRAKPLASGARQPIG